MFSGEGTASQCKGPVAGSCLMCLRSQEQSSVAEAQGAMRRVGGGEANSSRDQIAQGIVCPRISLVLTLV